MEHKSPGRNIFTKVQKSSLWSVVAVFRNTEHSSDYKTPLFIYDMELVCLKVHVKYGTYM